MPRRKKHFPCGHKGFGQFCHQCTPINISGDESGSMLDEVQERDKKEQLIAADLESHPIAKPVRNEPSDQATNPVFDAIDDPIALDGLPASVVRKCRQIFKHLQGSLNYNHRFRGKRLQFDRTVISIPLPQYYRMLCRDEGQAIVPIKVVSHQEYNKIVRNTGTKLN